MRTLFQTVYDSDGLPSNKDREERKLKVSSICPVEPFQGMSHNLLRSDANAINKVLPCNDLKAEQQLFSHARYHFLNAGTVPLSS